MKKITAFLIVVMFCLPGYGEVLVYKWSDTIDYFDLDQIIESTEPDESNDYNWEVNLKDRVKGFLVVDVNYNNYALENGALVTFWKDKKAATFDNPKGKFQKTIELDNLKLVRITEYSDKVFGWVFLDTENTEDGDGILMFAGKARNRNIGLGRYHTREIAKKLKGYILGDTTAAGSKVGEIYKGKVAARFNKRWTKIANIDSKDGGFGGDFDSFMDISNIKGIRGYLIEKNGYIDIPPYVPGEFIDPVANAGGPYIAMATSLDGALVELNGTDSNSPDGSSLIYEWDLDLSVDSDGDGNSNNDVDANEPIVELLFPIGQTEISLVVIDEHGLRSKSDITMVTVSGFIDPVANAGGPYIAMATSLDGALIELNGTGSNGPDGSSLIYEWDLDLSVDSDGDGNPNNDVDANEPIVELLFPIGQIEISLVVIDEHGLRSEPDITTVTVSEFNVGIDIKPGSFPNIINMGSHGVVPVAFLTDPAFDASTIDPATIVLRGEDFTDGLVKLRGDKDAPVPMATLKDVDSDGDLDLLVHLETEKLAAYGLEALCKLAALTYDGYVVSGSDTIRIVPER